MPNGETRYKVFAALLLDKVGPPITEVSISPAAGKLKTAEIWNSAWQPEQRKGKSGHIKPLEEAYAAGPGDVFPTPKSAVEVFLNYFAQQ